VQAEQEARGKYIDNTSSALNHYLFGDGSPAYIGDNTFNALINSEKFQTMHSSLILGTNKKREGTFSVDMTNIVFHIGRTNIDYKLELKNNQSKLTYNVFVNDGFWDPDLIDERYGKNFGNSSNFIPDGMGPNLERFGGRPYHYISRQLIYYIP